MGASTGTMLVPVIAIVVLGSSAAGSHVCRAFQVRSFFIFSDTIPYNVQRVF
jgi:hypothetical protein